MKWEIGAGHSFSSFGYRDAVYQILLNLMWSLLSHYSLSTFRRWLKTHWK